MLKWAGEQSKSRSGYMSAVGMGKIAALGGGIGTRYQCHRPLVRMQESSRIPIDPKG
jgi:hypothetical protein